MAEAYRQLEVAQQEYLELIDEENFEEEEEWLSPFTDRLESAKVVLNDYKDPSVPIVASSTVSQAGGKKLRVKCEKADSPKFSGMVLDYFDFRKEFEYVYDQEYTNEDKLFILRRSVPTDAKCWIEGINSIDEAWNVLNKHYGDPRLVSDAILTDISKIKPIPTNDVSKLTILYHTVNRAKNVLSNLQRASDLDNSTTLASIESKLSYSDREKWARYQMDKGMTANIENFLCFLENEISIRRLAGAEIRGGTSSSVAGTYHSSKPAFTKNVFASYDATKNEACAFCENLSHDISQCLVFSGKQQRARVRFVKYSGRCFNCMEKSHKNTECSKESTCVGGGCRWKTKHHKLLCTVPDATVNCITDENDSDQELDLDTGTE